MSCPRHSSATIILRCPATDLGLPEIGTKCACVKIAKINRFAPSQDGGES